ncbi:unnamed protein product, partial [marine sediment metagenome]
VAALGVVLPFILGYLVTIYFGFSYIVALFVGVALVATSIGVGASILTEFRMLRTRIGTLIMGAAVIDDVIGVVMMSVLIGFVATGSMPLQEMFLIVFLTLLFFAVSFTVGIKLFRKLSEKL